jgi:hypothetical protein
MIAAVGSAIAAICSYCIARKVFNYTKDKDKKERAVREMPKFLFTDGNYAQRIDVMNNKDNNQFLIGIKNFGKEAMELKSLSDKETIKVYIDTTTKNIPFGEKGTLVLSNTSEDPNNNPAAGSFKITLKYKNIYGDNYLQIIQHKKILTPENSTDSVHENNLNSMFISEPILNY